MWQESAFALKEERKKLMNNPKAFPVYVPSEEATFKDEVFNEGMSIRDYFAGQVLPHFTRIFSSQSIDNYMPEGVSKDCYLFADAMLAERNKNNG